MKKIKYHVLPWVIFIGLDMSGYLNVWKPLIPKAASINYSWLIITFYGASFFAAHFFRNVKDKLDLTRRWQFWAIIGMLALYILGSMCTDKYVLKMYSPASFWSYCMVRLVMGAPFIMIALFSAGYLNGAIQINLLRTQNNALKIEKSLLEYQKEKLEYEKEILALQYQQQEGVIIAMREEYLQSYERLHRMVDDMRNGTDF
jgi:hypothetical protein